MKSPKESPKNNEPEPPPEEYANATIPATAISLINSTLGSGMLGIPLAYAKSGLLIAILIHIIMAIVSYFSYYYLIYASDATQMFSLGEVWTCIVFVYDKYYSSTQLGSALYGASGILFTEIVNMIYCFGSLWSYLILDVDFITSLLRAAGVDEDSVFVSRWFVALLLSTLVLQPLTWFRSLNALRFTSILGTFAMSLCIVVIIYRYFDQNNDGEPRGDSPELVHKSFSFIQSFSTLTFAFSCQQNVPLAQGEIKKRSIKSMYVVSLLSICTTGGFYMLAGIFGYLSFTSSFFTSENSGNILRMYGDKDVLAIVARIASLITVTFCFPMNSLPCRVAIYNSFYAIRTIRQNRQRRNHPETLPILSARGGVNATDTDGLDIDSDSSDDSEEEIVETRETNVSYLTNDHSIKAIIISCAIGSILTYLAMGLSLLFDDVNLVFDLIGSTAGVAVGFVYPVMFYLRIRHNPKKYVSTVRYLDPNYPEMEEENAKRLQELLVERSHISAQPDGREAFSSSSSSSTSPPAAAIAGINYSGSYSSIHRSNSQLLRRGSSLLLKRSESKILISKSRLHLKRQNSQTGSSSNFFGGLFRKGRKKNRARYPHRAPFTFLDGLSYVVAGFGIICGILSFAMAIIFDTSLGDDIDL